ncbi:histone-lysine N-methyltransferase 2A [Alosa alosa]|nr:histone-lysine N-methyltransferase 2A [Alosa alosa]
MACGIVLVTRKNYSTQNALDYLWRLTSRLPSCLTQKLPSIGVVVVGVMMAATGFGSATVSTVAVTGGVAAARGRFPGRPFSSRSRLRSERRWQLSRSRTEPDDSPNGGLRPSCLALGLNEDPSHLRLLGIEASHKSLGEVGYSSSGSEEEDDFQGFETENGSPLQSGHRPSLLRKNVTTKASKKGFKKPTHVICRRSNPSNDTLMEEGSNTEDGSKKTRKRASPKQTMPSPRITIKFPSEAARKKEGIGPPKAEQKTKGLKFPSKAKKIQGAQISHVHVKLKKSKEVAGEAPVCVEETLITKRRGRSANKTVDSSVPEKSVVQHLDQKSGVKSRKVACKLDSAQKVENVTLSAENVNLKQKERKLEDSTRTCHRTSTLQPNDVGRSMKKQDQGIKGSAESVFESSALDDLSVQKVSLSKKKKNKRKKKYRKDSENNTITPIAENAHSSVDSEMERFKNGIDMGIPGLKLTRVRNTKSTSRKKRNKFVWTLTLVQGKSRANQMQEVENSSTGNSGIDSLQMHTSPPNESLLPLSEHPPGEETTIEKSSVKCKDQDESSRQSEEVNNLSHELETQGTTSPATMEATEEENEELHSKEVVPPLQIKVVSTPGKCNSLKQSFLIHQVSQPQREEESSTKDFSETTKMTESCSPIPPSKQSSALSTMRKKRSRHKPWTTYKRKPKKSSEEQTRTLFPVESICDPSTSTVLEQKNSQGGFSGVKSGPGENKPQVTDIADTQNAELSEPLLLESVPCKSSTFPDVQTEIKKESEKQSLKDKEVLVFEPSSNEDPEKETHTKLPLRHGKRRRRVLIGRRMKLQKPKVMQGKLTKNNDGCSTASSSTPVSKLIGVLKTKYRKRRYKASMDATSKQRDKVFSGEGGGGAVDEAVSDSIASPLGKSKCLKNIKHFIMPVVSARSSRVIKTPKRFMDDAGMSVLPRRNSPKKGHQCNVQSKMQKRNYDLSGTEAKSVFQVKEEEEDEFTESQLNVDVSATPVSQKDLDTCSSRMNPQNASQKIVGKRRSLLRDPSFKWHALGEEVYTLDKNLEYDYESFLGTKEFQTLINSDPSTLPLSIQEKKTSKKFNKKMSNLKKSKRLKKLNQGQTCSKRKKITHNMIGNTQPLPCDVDKIKQEECASGCTPDRSPSKSDKSKLKIEDLDTPGVVRKVSVSVRALSSKLLAMQYGAHEEVFEMNSLPENILDSDDSPVVSEISKVSQQNDFETRVDNKLLNSEEKVTSHRVRLTGANKRMFNLLKKAKVQLIKIDQQKQLKSVGLVTGSFASQEGALGVTKRQRGKHKKLAKLENRDCTVEQDVRRAGPRIKHVCRAAAVALGQPRAMIPDDIPRLSALPLHERSGISPSLMAQGVGSLSDPESPDLPEQKPLKFRRPSRNCFGLRSRRCGECKGCLHTEDCGKCMNCLDKPKFGGPNTKRQCCVMKRCDQIEERKALRLSGKLHKGHLKRKRTSQSGGHSSTEEGEGLEGMEEVGDSPSVRKQPRRCVRPRSYCDLLDYDSDLDITISQSTPPAKRKGLGIRSTDEFLGDYLDDEAARHRKPIYHRGSSGRRKIEKSPLEQTPPSVLAALANGFAQFEREPSSEPTHKIRVDFKEDCTFENVWQMGGLSILTSVPLMPDYVCLLCASKGHHEMLYCQVCCEPFHHFCLDPTERPSEENKENWCCRRCRFCHVCGHKSKPSKPLLECERCQNSYHPSCLGPNYPKPNKRKKTWVCMSCIRCRSCGVTPGKSWDTEWNHDKGLCPDCTKLNAQGNYCTICFKCYEDNDYESQMMQCATCNHWVHAKCEGLTDDLYEILSNLPESVVYSCQPCNTRQSGMEASLVGGEGVGWRELLQLELRAGVEKVLACLLSSTLSQHLVTCSQCSINQHSDGDSEQLAVCDLNSVGKKFDKGLYITLKSFHEDVVEVICKQLEEEESMPEDQRPTALARSYYLKLMEEVFTWFNSQDPKVWETRTKHLPPGILSHAVMPPTTEHMYAQWCEWDEQRKRKDQTILDRSNCLLAVNMEEVSNLTPLTHNINNKINRKIFRAARLKSKGMKERLSKVDMDTGWSQEDERQCSLCQKYGDSKSNEAGRLLYLGQNEWAHVNCSMWSAEVFEEDNGSLMHVHSAVARGRLMRCERCNKTGATVGCCLTSCQSNYHFMCARTRNCVFQDDKRVFCHKHRDLISGKMITGQGFEVLRRVYVDFEGISLRRKFLTGVEPESVNIMIGSLHIGKLGKLTGLSSKQGKLFPVGYECSRWYWSTKNPLRRCKYKCRIWEVRPPMQEKPVEECLDQGDNCTIAHSPCPNSAQRIDVARSNSQNENNPKLSPFATPALGSRHKVPQIRRPAGGMSRPLPSPGAAISKPHHILTTSDFDESRPRHHSPHYQTASSRHITAPPSGSTSGSFCLRAGGSMHPKSLQSTSSLVPLGAAENLMTSNICPVGRNAFATRIPAKLPHSTSGSLPQSQWPGVMDSPSTSLSSTMHYSPRTRLPCQPDHSDSIEIPHTFTLSFGSGSAENGSSLHETKSTQRAGHVDHRQEFAYIPFHVDADLSVSSELKAELEIDEALINEGVAMNCSAQIDVEGEMNQDDFWDRDLDEDKDKEQTMSCTSAASRENWGNVSSDEEMENYFDFTRTVITQHTQRDTQAPLSPSLRPIPQLDGVDDGTESDTCMTNIDIQNLKCSGQIQNPVHSDNVLPQAVKTSNGLSIQLEIPVSNTQPVSSAKALSQNVIVSDTTGGQSQEESIVAGSVSSKSLQVNPRPSLTSPTLNYASVQSCIMSSHQDSVNSCQPLPQNSTVEESLNFDLQDQNALLYQVPSLDLSVETPLILDKCEPSSPSTCFTELVPVQESVSVDFSDSDKQMYLDPNNGHFVSSVNGYTVYTPQMSGASDSPLPNYLSDGKDATDIIQPCSVTPIDSSVHRLQNHPVDQTFITMCKPVSPPSLPLSTTDYSQEKPALPALETFRAKLKTPVECNLSAPSAPIGGVMHTSTEGSLQQELKPFPTSATTLSLRPCSPVYSTNSQTLSSTMHGFIASSSSITSQVSTPCHSMFSVLQPGSAPLVLNGYNSSRVQKEATLGRTISINFSTPRSAIEPQQQVLNQALPGHAILTVKEVGGPNVDPTPHVLLVNRLGQIFVKNPESNTFQLPSPNSPSYSCVTQIASLLQSNAFSATLAAAGSMSATAPVVPVSTHVPKMMTPVQSSVAITQLLGCSSNGVDLDVRKSQKKSISAVAAPKKPRKKRESLLSRKSKSESKQDSKGNLPLVKAKTSSDSTNSVDSAQAIINQAMASYYDPCRTVNQAQSVSSIKDTLPAGKAQTLSSVLPTPCVLIEPEPASTPPSEASRPRTQVRMKRVSSISDRASTKKSKAEVMEMEPQPGMEDLCKVSLAVASRSGVRIKAPTVKGVLDLDKSQEEGSSDCESIRPGPWDRFAMSRSGDKLHAWDGAGRYSMTDWNKYSGPTYSCDELPPSDSEDETKPNQDQPHLRFEIISDDGFSVEADSIEVAWRAVTDGVQEVRAAHHLKQLTCMDISGAQMAGMLHDAVVFLVEQLEGAHHCLHHTFRFHKQVAQEEDLPVNPSGCARAEVYLRKSTFDMFNFLASQHRQLPDIGPYEEDEDDIPLKSIRRATNQELPMAMRFRHLERTSKEAVGVYRSAIHGRGLFCKRNIDAGEMVIEYAGIVIRSVLTDKREKYYNSKGIGCYMFRIDDFEVVDATMHGNAARFINHSCEPNCYSRVINVEGQKHIVIFALRKIYRGEELTYDYKFPIEDESNKLNCNCGARRCRRFLN